MMATGQSRDLMIELSEGNFGALRIITDMMYFSKWFSISSWLLKNGIAGERLYMLVNDDLNGDWMAFGEAVQREIHLGHQGWDMATHIEEIKVYAEVIKARQQAPAKPGKGEK